MQASDREFAIGRLRLHVVEQSPRAQFFCSRGLNVCQGYICSGVRARALKAAVKGKRADIFLSICLSDSFFAGAAQKGGKLQNRTDQ